nr:alpha/beta hydrolase [Candidatus Sigynarchaeota archaeon]
MPVVNTKLLRKDVRKGLKPALPLPLLIQVIKFTRRPENRGFNFVKLLRTIAKYNETYYKERIQNSDDPALKKYLNVISKEEMAFAARGLRLVTEWNAQDDLKKKPISLDIKIEQVDEAGVRGEWEIPPNAAPDRVLLWFHGGGQILGTPLSSRQCSAELGKRGRAKVFSLDYRLAPEHPFPEGLEDCVNAYKWLLKSYKPGNMIIAGESAGGQHVLSSLLKIKQDGLPLPAGALCCAPATDYYHQGPTFFDNMVTDPVLGDAGVFMLFDAYLAGKDPKDPLVSPVYGDLAGLPPILLQVSTIEMLRDHAVRFVEKARAAGVDITLQEFKDMTHAFLSGGYNAGWPEVEDGFQKAVAFIEKTFY